MKIAIVQNRFLNPTWPGLTRIAETEMSAMLPVCDYLVYCGPDLELLCHPSSLCAYKVREPIAAIVESESIHWSQPDFPAPIGYPKFRDDFFILKAGDYAERFLAAWHESHDVTAVAWALRVQPGLHADATIKAHCPRDAVPKIYWGVA